MVFYIVFLQVEGKTPTRSQDRVNMNPSLVGTRGFMGVFHKNDESLTTFRSPLNPLKPPTCIQQGTSTSVPGASIPLYCLIL